MDKVSITRDESGVGKVNLELQTGGYNVRGNPAALRMNQAQHSTRHPGETGFRYIQDLIGKPQQWLSKSFSRYDPRRKLALLLDQYIQRHERDCFDWHAQNCALFAARWVYIATGKTIVVPLTHTAKKKRCGRCAILADC